MNYYESEKEFFEQIISFQNHHRIDQWKTFTFSSTNTLAHSGLYTSHLACSSSLAVFYFCSSNTIRQILYFEDAYLQYLFITSLNTVSDQKT